MWWLWYLLNPYTDLFTKLTSRSTNVCWDICRKWLKLKEIVSNLEWMSPYKNATYFEHWYLEAHNTSHTWNVPFRTCSMRLSWSSKCFKFFKKWKDVSLIVFNWLLLRSNCCKEVKCLIASAGNAEPVNPCDIFSDISEWPIWWMFA